MERRAAHRLFEAAREPRVAEERADGVRRPRELVERVEHAEVEEHVVQREHLHAARVQLTPHAFALSVVPSATVRAALIAAAAVAVPVAAAVRLASSRAGAQPGDERVVRLFHRLHVLRATLEAEMLLHRFYRITRTVQ